MILSADIWISDKEQALTLLEQSGSEEPLTTLRHIDDIHFDSDRLRFSFAESDLPISIHGNLAFTGNKQNRRMVQKMTKSVGLDQPYQADDRGRVTLGSQYAGKTVKIAVIEVEDSGESDDG